MSILSSMRRRPVAAPAEPPSGALSGSAFEANLLPSLSSPSGHIVQLKGLSRA